MCLKSLHVSSLALEVCVCLLALAEWCDLSSYEHQVTEAPHTDWIALLSLALPYILLRFSLDYWSKNMVWPWVGETIEV